MSASNRQTYADGTYLQSSLYGFTQGRALCSDGKIRTLKRIAANADTFFSVPASVEVCKNGKRYTVISVSTREGYSTATENDPAIVKFRSYIYRRNGAVLP